MADRNGLWRRLVARLTGGQKVVGSNPASPTHRSPRNPGGFVVSEARSDPEERPPRGGGSGLGAGGVLTIVHYTRPVAGSPLPTQLAGLYLDVHDAKAGAAVAFAVQFLSIAAIFQIADGQQVSAAFSLRGLKDTSVPMWIAGFSYWVIGFPICIALAFGLGWEGRGVWIGLAIALMAAAVLMTWRFEYLTRRHKLGAEA